MHLLGAELGLTAGERRKHRVHRRGGSFTSPCRHELLHPVPRYAVVVSGEAWFTLVIALATIGLLAADRYSAVLVMGGALVTLFVAGIIDEDQAFGGFSNEAPITVAALYVLTGAADATGALEGHITRVLGSGRRRRPRRDRTRRVCLIPPRSHVF